LPIHHPRPTRPPHPGNRSRSLDAGTRTNDQKRERLLGNSLGSESAKRSRFRAPTHHAKPFRVRRDQRGFIQSGRYDSPKRCLLADAARRKNTCGLVLPGGDTPGGPQGRTSALKPKLTKTGSTTSGNSSLGPYRPYLQKPYSLP